LEYHLLKEYKRQNKYNEYIKLKKELVETLKLKNWSELAGKLLREDREFVKSHLNSITEAVAIEMQLDELAITKSNTQPHETLFT
jgi:hypothetical protein